MPLVLRRYTVQTSDGVLPHASFSFGLTILPGVFHFIYWLMLESVPNPLKLSFIDAIIKQSVVIAGQVTANPPQIRS